MNRTWTGSVAAEEAEIVAHTALNAEYRHLTLRCHGPATTAVPGQFFQLLCPQLANEAPYLRRPMSLYGVDIDAGTVEFLYKIAGAGTRGLSTLCAGDRLDIMGPLGVGFSLRPEWKNVVAVGRGAGLATLAPLARVIRMNGAHLTAIFSARRPDLIVSVELFKREQATIIPVTDTEGTSGPANVERLLRGLIADNKCDAFFTCGSSRLMRVQQRLAIEFGLPGQIAMEQQMACGIGVCFCCVRDFNVEGQIVQRRVCWEGPVFDLLEAMP